MKLIITICMWAMLMFSQVLWAQNFYNEKPQDSDQFSLSIKNVNTRSIRGWKTGGSINLELKDRYEIGYLYLTSLNNSDQSQDVFSGVQASMKFNITKRIQLGGGIRLGAYNQEFIVLLPSIRSKVKITNRIFTEFAYAHSDGFPLFEMNLGFKILKN